MLELAKWGRFSVLGHLTLPLRYMNENLGEHMTFNAHMAQVADIFRTIIPKGLGIECNTNRGNTPLPDGGILRLYREMGGEVITTPTPAIWWAALSGSGSSCCGTADSGISARSRAESPSSTGYKRKRRTRP